MFRRFDPVLGSGSSSWSALIFSNCWILGEDGFYEFTTSRRMETTDRNKLDDTSEEGGKRNALSNPFASLEAELLKRIATKPATPKVTMTVAPKDIMSVPSQRGSTERTKSRIGNGLSISQEKSKLLSSARKTSIQESIAGFRYVAMAMKQWSYLGLTPT